MPALRGLNVKPMQGKSCGWAIVPGPAALPTTPHRVFFSSIGNRIHRRNAGMKFVLLPLGLGAALVFVTPLSLSAQESVRDNGDAKARGSWRPSRQAPPAFRGLCEI